MANEIEGDIPGLSEVVGVINRLTSGLARLGQDGDKIFAGLRNDVDAYRKELQRLESAINSTDLANKKSEANARSVAELQRTYIRVLQNLAQAATDAKIRSESLTGALDGQSGAVGRLTHLLMQTANDQSFIRWQLRAATSSNEMANQSRALHHILEGLDSTEAANVATLKAQLAEKNRNYALDTKRQITLARLTEQVQYLNSGTAREIEQQRARARLLQQNLTTEARALAQSERMITAAERRSAAEERLNRILQGQRERQFTGVSQAYGNRLLTGSEAGEMGVRGYAQESVERYNRILVDHAKALAAASGGANRLTQTQADIISRTREATSETERYNRALQAQTDYLRQGGAASAAAAIARQREAARREMDVTGLSSAFGVNINRAGESQMLAMRAAAERAATTLNNYNLAAASAAAGTDRLSRQQAEQVVQTERLTAAAERHNAALLAQTRLATPDSGRASAQYSAQITQLRNQLADQRGMRDSAIASAGEVPRLQRQIAEMQALNAAYGRSTASLLGLTDANTGMVRGFRTSEQVTASWRAGLAGLNASFGIFTSSTILVASAAYGFTRALRGVISEGAQFTKSISTIQALMQDESTFGNMTAQLQQSVAAIKLAGAVSIFSATQAAEGFQYLVMSGMNASKAIDSLQGSLNLAAVANVSMKDAADISTNILSAFGLQADDLGSVVDKMAAAVTASNTSMSELANAIKYVGPAATATGISLDDVTAVLATLANNGIKASSAGTGLRRMITSLANPTAKGTEVLNRYGIAVQNADGSTRSLVDILADLNRGMYAEGITETQRLADVNRLVGQHALSAAAAMIRMAGTGSQLEEFRRRLEGAEGTAARMAKVMTGNLSGDWERFTSNVSDRALQMFTALEPQIRQALANITEFISGLDSRAVSDFADRVSGLASTLGDVLKAVLLLKAASMAASLGTVMGGWVGTTGVALASRVPGAAAQAAGPGIAAAGAVGAGAVGAGAGAMGAGATAASAGTAASMLLATQQSREMNRSLTTLPATAGRAEAAVSRLGRGMVFLGGALGSVVGGLLRASLFGAVAYGAYQLYRAFTDLSEGSKRAAEETEEVTKRNQDLIASYQTLRNEIDLNNRKSASEEMTASVSAQEAAMQAMRDRYEQMGNLAKNWAAQGFDVSRIRAGMQELETTMVSAADVLEDARLRAASAQRALSEPDVQGAEYAKAIEQLLTVQENLAEAVEKQDELSRKISYAAQAQNPLMYYWYATSADEAKQRVMDLEKEQRSLEALLRGFSSNGSFNMLAVSIDNATNSASRLFNQLMATKNLGPLIIPQGDASRPQPAPGEPLIFQDTNAEARVRRENNSYLRNAGNSAQRQVDNVVGIAPTANAVAALRKTFEENNATLQRLRAADAGGIVDGNIVSPDRIRRAGGAAAKAYQEWEKLDKKRNDTLNREASRSRRYAELDMTPEQRQASQRQQQSNLMDQFNNLTPPEQQGSLGQALQDQILELAVALKQSESAIKSESSARLKATETLQKEDLKTIAELGKDFPNGMLQAAQQRSDSLASLERLNASGSVIGSQIGYNAAWMGIQSRYTRDYDEASGATDVRSLQRTNSEGYRNQLYENQTQLEGNRRDTSANSYLAAQAEIDINRKLNDDLERLEWERQTKQITISTDAYNARVKEMKAHSKDMIALSADLYSGLEEQRTDWRTGVSQGLSSLQLQATDFAGQTKQAISGAFNGLRDSIVSAVNTGKLSLTDMLLSTIQMVQQMLVQFALVRSAQAGLAFAGSRGGLLGSAAGLLTGLAGSVAGGGAVAARGASTGVSLPGQFSFGRSLARGGYAGDGHVNKPMGTFHAGEHVLKASAVKAPGVRRLAEDINASNGRIVSAGMSAAPNITYAPNITIESSGSGGASSAQDSQRQARQMEAVVRRSFQDMLEQEIRQPGGSLYHTRRTQ